MSSVRYESDFFLKDKLFDVFMFGDTLQQLLWATRIDPKDIDMTIARGFTPLTIACYKSTYGVVEMLLEKGANIDLADNIATPLQTAILYGETDVVRLLLEQGADASKRDKSGNSLSYYVFKCPLERVKQLNDVFRETKTPIPME